MSIIKSVIQKPESIYCNECKEFLPFVLTESQLTASMRGLSFSYRGFVCRCEKCHTPSYPLFVEDYNLNAKYEAYRSNAGILSLAKIREIPEKYNIGVRPLSLILGWGEQTFTRFYNGELPSEKYSDIIKNISDNPREYRRLLCLNSDKITTVAMKKSLKAVDDIIGDISEDHALIKTACYICRELPDVTALALQKLLYYINGFYSAFIGASCFSDMCYAWEYGPVYPTIYFLKKEGNLESQFSKDGPPDISDQLKEIADSVIKYFGCFSGDKLTEFTHSETPWFLIRDKNNDDIVIPQTLISNYFASVIEKHKTCPIQAYASELFNR